MLICVATMASEEHPLSRPVDSFDTGRHDWFIRSNDAENIGVVRSYQEGYKKALEERYETLAYLHDDVLCREQDWDLRVEEQFKDPTVGLVGFGGALRHGTDDIYKTPYRLQQLARDGYLSNTDDAETHGQRFTGECDVAVLDGFALIVRREMLDRAWRLGRCGAYLILQMAHGWPTSRLTFHCYDYWLCCMAHRLGYRIRLVGIRCHHIGGQTSTQPAYQKWLADRGTSDQEDHERSHRFIYDEFRDVLPWRCG